MSNQIELQRLRDAADAAQVAAREAWEAAWVAQNQRFLEIVGARGGSK